MRIAETIFTQSFKHIMIPIFIHSSYLFFHSKLEVYIKFSSITITINYNNNNNNNNRKEKNFNDCKLIKVYNRAQLVSQFLTLTKSNVFT